MKHITIIFFVIISISSIVTAEEPREPERFVLVELFTSQGCSSCPPADELLSKIANEPAYAEKIVPLAFHVDYWDNLGWKDSFSKQQWTFRQKRYANAFMSNQIYTPQMIVDGRYQWVGSDEEKVRFMLDTALGEKDEAEVHIQHRLEEETLHVSVSGKIDAGISMDGTELFVVLFESGFETDVKQGENSGKRLHDDFVVRKLERFQIHNEEDGIQDQKIEFKIDDNWNVKRSGVVAYIQNFQTRTVLGGNRVWLHKQEQENVKNRVQ